MKQITKKYKDEIFVWDPLSFSGKGYWYVLGTKGGYGRAASKKEAKSLGKPEVPKEISPHTETPTETHKEEIEPIVGDDEERMPPSAKAIKRAKYREAERIKGTKLSELITNNLIEGKGAFGSVTSAIGTKISARGTRLKKMFDLRERMNPLNIAKFLTGGSSMGPALLGRILGSSQEDIEHYSGRRAKGSRGTASLIRSALTGKKITPVDSAGNAASDAAQKLVNLFSKYFEDKKRELEIKRSFEEEREAEELRRHKQLIEAITGKPYKGGATATKVGTGSLLDMLMNYAGPAARLVANAATTAARFMFTNPVGIVAAGGLALSAAATGVLASEAGRPLRESFKAENDPNGMLSAMSGDTGIAANILMNGEQTSENAIAGKKANLLANRPSDKKSMLFWKDGDLQKKYLEEVGWDEKTGTIKSERDAGAIGMDASGKLIYRPQVTNSPPAGVPAAGTPNTTTPATAPASAPPLPSGVMAPPPSTSPVSSPTAVPVSSTSNSGQRIDTAMAQQGELMGAGTPPTSTSVVQNSTSVTIPGQNTTGVVGNNPVRNLDDSLEKVQRGSLRTV